MQSGDFVTVDKSDCALQKLWHEEHLLLLALAYLQPVELLAVASCSRSSRALCDAYDQQLWQPHIVRVWRDCVEANRPDTNRTLLQRLMRKYAKSGSALKALDDADTSCCGSHLDYCRLLQAKELFGRLLRKQHQQQKQLELVGGPSSSRKCLWPSALPTDINPDAPHSEIMHLHVQQRKLRRQSDSSIGRSCSLGEEFDSENGPKDIAPPSSSPSSVAVIAGADEESGNELLQFPKWVLQLAPFKATYVHSVLERCRNYLKKNELVAMKWRFHFRISNNPESHCCSQFFSDGTMRLDVSENIYYYKVSLLRDF